MDLAEQIDELLDLDMDEIPIPTRKPAQKPKLANGHNNSNYFSNGSSVQSPTMEDDSTPNATSKSRKKRREKQNDTLNGTVLVQQSNKTPQTSKSQRTKRVSVNSWDEDDVDNMFNTFTDRPVDRSMDLKEVNEGEEGNENVRKSKSRARRREETNGLESTPSDARQRRRKSKHRTQEEADNLDQTTTGRTEERTKKRKGRKKREQVMDEEPNMLENTNPLNSTFPEPVTESVSLKRQNRRKKKYGDERDGLNATMNGQSGDMNVTSGKSRRKKSSQLESLNQSQEISHKETPSNTRKKSVMYGDVDSDESVDENDALNATRNKVGMYADSTSEDQLDDRKEHRKKNNHHKPIIQVEGENYVTPERKRKSKRRKEPLAMSVDDLDADDVVDEEPFQNYKRNEPKRKSHLKKTEMSLDDVDGDDYFSERQYEKPSRKKQSKPTETPDELDDDIDELVGEVRNTKSKGKHIDETLSKSKKKKSTDAYQGTKKGNYNRGFEDEDEEEEPPPSRSLQAQPPRRPSKAFLASESEETEDSDEPTSSNKLSPSHLRPTSRNTTDTDDPSPSHGRKYKSRERPPTGHSNKRLPPSGKTIDDGERPSSSMGLRPSPKPQSSAGTPSVHRRNSIASNAPSTRSRRSSIGSFYVPSMGGMQVTTGDMTGIFSIGGHSYDVTLNDHRISWSSVTGAAKVPKAQRASRKSTIFSKRRRSSLKDLRASLDDSNANSIDFADLLGAAIKRSKHQKTEEGVGTCEGVGLYLYEKKAPNKLRDFILILGHPDEGLCRKWVHRIQVILREFPNRPKKVKTFLQPFAGRKYARTVHAENVHKLFQAAGIEEDIIEVTHNEKVKQELIHTDLCDYDALVILAGDGTVSQVLNGLLNRTQWEFENKIQPGFTPNKGVIPLGIVPCGTTNQIVHSVQGIDDVSTAVIHIILGNHQAVDVCSVYREDEFQQWAINSHYGFFGHSLRYMHEFALFGSKKIEAALAKSLKKQKFFSYDVELQYIPDTSTRQTPKRGAACRKGCSTCEAAADEHNPAQYQQYDHVHSLQHQDSSDSSDITGKRRRGKDNSQPSPWLSVKGEFINVSVLCSPALSQHAPLGMSKLSHLADGAVDLAVVRKTDRTEFIRFLRRHGKAMHKNQYDMPFVETFRCREIRCSIRQKETWKHVDHGYSEIQYQEKKSQKKVQKDEVRRSKTERVISDLGNLDSEDEDEEDEEDDDDSEEDQKKEETRYGYFMATPEAKKKKSGGFTVTKANPANPTPAPRPTLAEMEAERRKQNQVKREEKRKWKAVRKNQSLWNLDNEICTELDLHFRVHRGLVTIYGDGIDSALQPEEVNMGCLSML